MTKEYIPIGMAPVGIVMSQGKSIRQTSDYITATELLEFVRQEYPLAYITSGRSENGHLNRDGEYSCTVTTYYTIVEDRPYYSYADNMEMLKERLAVAFAGSKMFPVDGERKERLKQFRKNLGLSE